MTMSRQNHDVYRGHYLLVWAEADQARLRRLGAEGRLCRQLRAARSAGVRCWLAALLRPFSAGLRLLVGLPTGVDGSGCGWSSIARARCYPTVHADGLTAHEPLDLATL
jgi:hypothetical protein